MQSLVGALADTIRGHGGEIMLDAPVVDVELDGSSRVVSVGLVDGERFAADIFLANIDPQTFVDMVTDGRIESGGKRLPNYEQSNSLTSLFLGIRDASCLEGTFGRWNIWYSPTDKPPRNLYESDPTASPQAMYLNSPTLLTGCQNDAPPGGATVTVFVPGAIEPFALAAAESREALELLVERHTEQVLDVIGERFIPGLREQLDAVETVTALDNHRLLRAPEGAIYGKSLTPKGAMTRIPSRGVFPNAHFVGHYPAFAGIPSVIRSGCLAYEAVTGERI